MITAIACVFNTGTEFYIGQNNDLLFDIRSDKRFFRNYIKRKTLICGYKTYKTLPKDIIESHMIIVLTKNHYKEKEFDHIDRLEHFVFSDTNKVLACQDITEILRVANKFTHKSFIVIGGGEIYKQFESCIDFWHLTMVDDCIYDPIELANNNAVKIPFVPKKLEYNYTDHGLSSRLIEYDYKTETNIKFIIRTYYRVHDIAKNYFELREVQKLVKEYVR